MSLYANEDGILKDISALDSGSITIQGMDLLKTFTVTRHTISVTVQLPRAISMYKFIIVLARDVDNSYAAIPVILEVNESFCSGSSVTLACAASNSSSTTHGFILFKRTDDYIITLKDSGNPDNGTYVIYGLF